MWNFRQTLCGYTKPSLNSGSVKQLWAVYQRVIKDLNEISFFSFIPVFLPVLHIRKLRPNSLNALYKSRHIYLNEERSVVHRPQTQINHSSLSGWTCTPMNRKCPARLKCDSSYAAINKWWCLETFPDRNLETDSPAHISSRLSSSGHLPPSLPEIVPFQHKVTGMAVRGQRAETPRVRPPSPPPSSSLPWFQTCCPLRLVHPLTSIRAKFRLNIISEIMIWGSEAVCFYDLYTNTLT